MHYRSNQTWQFLEGKQFIRMNVKHPSVHFVSKCLKPLYTMCTRRSPKYLFMYFKAVH